MIYLIGGPPRCGKTMVAKLLASKLAIPCVTADMLESVIEAYTPDEQHDALFPKNAFRQLTHQSNDEMYAQYSITEIVQAYIIQGRTTWRAVEVLVEHAQKFNEHIVIDGHQLHPEFIDRFMKAEGGKNVRPVIMIKKEVNLIVAGAKENKAANDWFLQKTKHETTLPLIAEMIKRFGIFFEEQAQKYQIKTLVMDTDFEKNVARVVQYLAV